MICYGCTNKSGIKDYMSSKEYPAVLNTVIDDLINKKIVDIKDTLLIDERIFIDTLNGYTYGPVNLKFWHTYLKESLDSSHKCNFREQKM
jgi:hypothetical protein